PKDMIFNEIQSRQRPFDDADTKMQVTPMSWVPNRIKEPIGRKASDEPLVDRGLNHAVKEDVTTRDEDNDVGVRTRRRFTPGIPTADTVTAGLSETTAQTETKDLVVIIQTYHETMQSNPDLAKTFLLGAIRMMERWVASEEPRIDLKEGGTPLEWLAGNLLPTVIADMTVLENYFDRDVDMIFYRQWRSEAMRVKRKAHDKIKAQAALRRERDEDEAKTNMLDEVKQGELLEWSMLNPEDALELYEDTDHRDRYVERLMDELFGDEGIRGFLDQADVLASLTEVQDEDEEPDPKLIMLQEAFLEMDMGRLEELRNLEEMEDLIPLIAQSIDALSALTPIMRGIVMSMMHLYGSSGSGLEDIARHNPVHTVITVTRGPETRPIPQAVIRPTDDSPAPHPPAHLPEEEEEEEDGKGDDDDDDDDNKPKDEPKSST
ncbi:MAG: hypothetical protein ACI8S6_003275, partial [Myxococcota bacterium]